MHSLRTRTCSKHGTTLRPQGCCCAKKQKDTPRLHVHGIRTRTCSKHGTTPSRLLPCKAVLLLLLLLLLLPLAGAQGAEAAGRSNTAVVVVLGLEAVTALAVVLLSSIFVCLPSPMGLVSFPGVLACAEMVQRGS